MLARYPVGMECPSCNDSGAYCGLQWIHCLNENCYHYDAKYVDKVRNERHERSVKFLRDNFIVLPDDDKDNS